MSNKKRRGDGLSLCVYTIPKSPACTATVEKLRMLGVKFEERPMKDARPFMHHQNYQLAPVVVVWEYLNHRRHPYLSWEGHRPQMLELASRKVAHG